MSLQVTGPERENRARGPVWPKGVQNSQVRGGEPVLERTILSAGQGRVPGEQAGRRGPGFQGAASGHLREASFFLPQ